MNERKEKVNKFFKKMKKSADRKKNLVTDIILIAWRGNSSHLIILIHYARVGGMAVDIEAFISHFMYLFTNFCFLIDHI